MTNKGKAKKSKPPQEELGLNRRKFLAVYIETRNATEAAMQAFNCKDRKSAKVLGHNTLTSINQGVIKDKMDAAGLSDEYLMQKMHEGLDAEKTEFAKHMGEIKEQVNCIDFPTRKSYLDLALKWKGELKEHLIHEGAVPVSFTGDNAEEFIKSKIDG